MAIVGVDMSWNNADMSSQITVADGYYFFYSSWFVKQEEQCAVARVDHT